MLNKIRFSNLRTMSRLERIFIILIAWFYLPFILTGPKYIEFFHQLDHFVFKSNFTILLRLPLLTMDYFITRLIPPDVGLGGIFIYFIYSIIFFIFFHLTGIVLVKKMQNKFFWQGITLHVVLIILSLFISYISEAIDNRLSKRTSSEITVQIKQCQISKNLTNNMKNLECEIQLPNIWTILDKEDRNIRILFHFSNQNGAFVGSDGIFVDNPKEIINTIKSNFSIEKVRIEIAETMNPQKISISKIFITSDRYTLNPLMDEINIPINQYIQ